MKTFSLVLLILLLLPHEALSFHLGGRSHARQPQTARTTQRYADVTANQEGDSFVGGDSGPPGNPNVIIYPGTGWGLSKPEPKASLYDVGTADSAKAPILNLIELVHWISFPIGFYLVWTMFQNNIALGQAIGGTTRGMEAIAAMMLAHLCQVFGGGISGNMMHQYEGWQVAVFRNPLDPYTNTTTGVVEQEPAYNDAWLRAVAYQMLFSFQTLGVLLTAVASFGTDSFGMQFLVVATFVVMTLSPQLPHCTTVLPKLMNAVKLGKVWTWLTQDRPVFPLSIYLFLVFLVNSIVAWNAYGHMFHSLEWSGHLGVLGSLLDILPTGFMAAFPFFLVALGGIYEGLVAETTFNQWDHFIAFIMLDAGLALHLPYYLNLIGKL